MMRVAFSFVWLAVIGCGASAQTETNPFDKSPATLGGTTRLPNATQALPTFGPSAGAEILRHRNFTGEPCLVVSGNPRRHTINPNLYDHVITVRNKCPQRIALQVCYYHSEDCVPMQIPGGEQKEAILGTLPSIPDFRFEFREKF